MPTISVIIPTYNRAGFLIEAIESVLTQTFTDFEVVVIDDGSSDNTATAVAALADPRIRYFYQENSGRSAARNRGLQEAQGKYIALLDDDDRYLPHKLEWQTTFLEMHSDVDLVVSGTKVIDGDGRLVAIWRRWHEQPVLTLEKCLYACPLSTCTVLFHRRWLEVLNHWFDTTMDRAEDTDFFIRLLYAGCRMAWLPEIVSARRLHQGASQPDQAYGQGFVQMLDKLFARVDLPLEVWAQKGELYAHYHAVTAFQAYAAQEVLAAQEAIEVVLTYKPEWGCGDLPELASRIANFANSHWVQWPADYIEFVFAHLPKTLSYFSRYRRATHGLFYIQRIFKARQVGETADLEDWLRGVFFDPSWLGNRGVWSILMRDIIGFHPTPRKAMA